MRILKWSLGIACILYALFTIATMVVAGQKERARRQLLHVVKQHEKVLNVQLSDVRHQIQMQDITRKLTADISAMAQKNPKMEALLTKNGFAKDGEPLGAPLPAVEMPDTPMLWTELGKNQNPFDENAKTPYSDLKTCDDEITKAVLVLQEDAVHLKGVQDTLQKLVLDLLELAKTDADAKSLTDKYKIESSK